MTAEQCRAMQTLAAPRRIVPAGMQPLRIAHFVTALNSGGAERQACYAAIGQQAQGHNVRVLTRLALVGNWPVFHGAVNWAVDRDSLLNIPPRPIERFQLSLSAGSLLNLRYTLLLALPGTTALLGLLVYWTRRN